jgi:hypothetical protein
LTNAAPYAKYFPPNSSKIAMRYVANAQNKGAKNKNTLKNSPNSWIILCFSLLSSIYSRLLSIALGPDARPIIRAHARSYVLLALPVVSPLLATGMTSPDDRALGRVPRSGGSDCGTGCRTLSLWVGALLLLVLCLLLILRLLLGLRRPGICRLCLR